MNVHAGHHHGAAAIMVRRRKRPAIIRGRFLAGPRDQRRIQRYSVESALLKRLKTFRVEWKGGQQSGERALLPQAKDRRAKVRLEVDQALSARHAIADEAYRQRTRFSDRLRIEDLQPVLRRDRRHILRQSVASVLERRFCEQIHLAPPLNRVS